MEYIKKILKKTGWISILESIIFIILGAVMVWEPEGTIKTISYIIGGIFIAIGVFKIFSYFASKGQNDFYNNDLIYGLMACVLGIVAIVCSTTISSVLRVIMGIWIIYSSFIRINLSIKLKKFTSKIWIYSLVLAIVMFICGLYITLNQGAIMVTVGIMIIVYSVIDIIENIIFMRNVKEVL